MSQSLSSISPTQLPDWIEKAQDILSKMARRCAKAAPSRKKKAISSPEFRFIKSLVSLTRSTMSKWNRPPKSTYSTLTALERKIPNLNLDVIPRRVVHKTISLVRHLIESPSRDLVASCVKGVKALRALTHAESRSLLRKQMKSAIKSREEAFQKRKYRREIRSLLEVKPAFSDFSMVLSDDGPVTGERNTLPLISQHISSTMTNPANPDLPSLQTLFPPPGNIPLVPLLLPSVDKIIDYWKGRKKGTAPGLSGCSINALLGCPRIIQEDVATTLILVWEHFVLIPSWRKVKLILLPKKSNPSPKDFRPISFLEVMRKTLLGWLIREVMFEGNDSLSPFQFGFRTNSGCDNASSLLTSIIIRAKATSQPAAGVSVDVSKAFDKVPWSFLPIAMDRIGVPRRLIDFLLLYLVESDGSIHGSTVIEKVRETAGVPKAPWKVHNSGMPSSTSSSPLWIRSQSTLPGSSWSPPTSPLQTTSSSLPRPPRGSERAGGS